MKKFNLDGLRPQRKPPVARVSKRVPGLCLSGGGANGAYQLGVLQYMAGLNRFRRGFKVVSGTSVGSLNGAGVAMYPPSKFRHAVDNLVEKWRLYVNKDEDVYQYYWPKYLSGAWRTSLAKSDQLLKMLRNIVDEEAVKSSGIKVRFPAVDLITGRVVVWDETSADLVSGGLMASASYPIVFPLVPYDQLLLTDGGVVDIAPLSHAIKAGATSIIVIHTGFSAHMETPPKNVAEVALRVVNLMADEILRNDLMKIQKVNEQLKTVPELEKLGYHEILVDIIGPSEDLGDSLDFSADKRERQIELGMSDAREHFSDAD